MTGMSRKERLRFWLDRTSRQARAHLPELGLSGLVTAGELVLLLQDELRGKAIDAVVAVLPASLLIPLAIVAPVVAGLGTHLTRRLRARETPPPLPVGGQMSFPDRVEPLLGRGDKVREVVDRSHDSGVVVVQGGTGTGTSTLAVHAAWELAPEESRQRYVDVRGPDRDRPETELSVAQRVLRALGSQPGLIQEPHDAAPLIKEALSGRDRVLLLDNVSTWSQVAWLPPRVPDAHIVIAGELAGELPQHIKPVQVGPLSAEDGEALLAAQVRDDRVTGDPLALRSLVEACVRSPAEIVKLGRWLARNPGVTLAALVDDLSRLPVDERLRFVLQRSMQGVDPAAKRLFVLLAGLPVAEVDHRAAAALLGVPSADDAIAELSGRGLVENVRMTRVRVIGAFHDSGSADDAAWRRLVEHFAAQAEAYASLLPDDPGAGAWFAAEDRVLLQVLAREQPVRKTARALGRIGAALEAWFALEQRHEDRLRAAALLAWAAWELGDERVRAAAELRQAKALITLGNPEKARQHFNRAAAAWGAVEAWPPELHLTHATILLASGDEFTAVESALVRYGQALAHGDTAGHAIRLVNVAALLMRRAQPLDGGEARRLYADARAVLFEALHQAEQSADERTRAHAHELLGLAHWQLDHARDAMKHWKESERLYERTADDIGRARCRVQRATACAAEAAALPDRAAALAGEAARLRREAAAHPDRAARLEREAVAVLEEASALPAQAVALEREAVALLREAEPRLPPEGLTTALAHLQLAALCRAEAGQHRAAGLAALAPWDGIAEPRQVTEIRNRLQPPEPHPPAPS
ncbi:hypothetical protein ACIBF7_34125 [Nonomuraea sp. NPDC050478]|uniref:hypothetical protein n=1 Tax=Nonomuraea sp. NPDC050478 TaxID=3364365 RepID=UPI003792127F